MRVQILSVTYLAAKLQILEQIFKNTDFKKTQIH